TPAMNQGVGGGASAAGGGGVRGSIAARSSHPVRASTDKTTTRRQRRRRAFSDMTILPGGPTMPTWRAPGNQATRRRNGLKCAGARVGSEGPAQRGQRAGAAPAGAGEVERLVGRREDAVGDGERLDQVDGAEDEAEATRGAHHRVRGP